MTNNTHVRLSRMLRPVLNDVNVVEYTPLDMNTPVGRCEAMIMETLLDTFQACEYEHIKYSQNGIYAKIDDDYGVNIVVMVAPLLSDN